MRAVLAALALALAAGPARGQIVFEPEDPAPEDSTPRAPTDGSGPGITFEPEATDAPPTDARDAWRSPEVSFDFATRLAIDTSFDRGGENAVLLHRRASLAIRTEKGRWRLAAGARLRWTSSAEAPEDEAFLLVNGTRPRSAFEVLPGEISLATRAAGVDWSAGLFDLAWGQNHAFAAADVLTPIDLRDGPLASPDSRLTVPAVRARTQLGAARVEAAWLPVFVPSRLPLLGNDWSPFVPGRTYAVPDFSRYLDPSAYAALEPGLLATRHPRADLGAPQGGLRVAFRPGPLDVAISWAEHFDRQPVLSVTPAFERLVHAIDAGDEGTAFLAAAEVQSRLERGESPMTGEFARTRTFALDAALLTGAVRWTLDLGYSPARVFTRTDLRSARHPMAGGALGIEYEGPPILAGGVYALAVFDVGPHERLLYVEPDAAPAVERDVVLALAWLAASQSFFDDRLRVQLAALASQRGDFFVAPLVRWHPREWLGLGVGANVPGGRAGGAGAMYRRNREAFVDLALTL